MVGYRLKPTTPLVPYLTLKHPHLKTKDKGGGGRSWRNQRTQAMTLAEAILARYLSRPGSWSRLGLTYKPDPRKQPTQIHHTWLNRAPRMLLTLLLRRERSVQLVRHTLPAGDHDWNVAWPVARRALPGQATGKLVRRLWDRETVQIVSTHTQRTEYLLRRGQRVEAAGSPSGANRQASAASQANVLPFELAPQVSLPGVRPVPRIVHRAAQRQIEAAGRPSAGVQRPAVGANAPPIAAAPRPVADMDVPPVDLGQPAAPVSALNLERLTDQVVQAIDRRIIAQRERLGRI